MRAQEKNIKGFNVLELIAVVLIIGIISAAAYPKFSGWKTQREIRDAALKIKSLMLAINAQAQRGLYSFVQVYVNITDTDVQVLHTEASDVEAFFEGGTNVFDGSFDRILSVKICSDISLIKLKVARLF